MLTRFKQQAQETGVFLKKQQQAFSQQVQKGIKMAASLKPGQKKEHILQHALTPTRVSEQSDEQCYTRDVGQDRFAQMGEWSSALVQMGFESTHISEAARMLGGQPEHMDDLLQAVVALVASEEGAAASSSSSSSSSIDEQRPVESEPFLATSVRATSQEKHVFESEPPLPPPAAPPPLPAVSACGSATFENSEDKAKFLHAASSKLNVKIYDALVQMGFESEAIHAAFQLLGEDATVDDFFDLLLRMPDAAEASLQVQMDTSTGSVDVLYEAGGHDSEEDQKNQSVPDLTAAEPTTNKDLAGATLVSAIPQASLHAPSPQESSEPSKYDQTNLSEMDSPQIEPSARDLAALIVASAIAKASPKIPSTFVAKKQIPGHSSPKRGGA
jgi:Holliday junction resolvasome RuvABC DNA-binding subunit